MCQEKTEGDEKQTVAHCVDRLHLRLPIKDKVVLPSLTSDDDAYQQAK